MQRERWLGKLENKYLIIILIIIFFIGFIVGFICGVQATIKQVVDIASRFIEIDYDTVQAALNQYNSHIKGCYPIQL